MVNPKTYNIKFPYKSENETGIFDTSDNQIKQMESRLLMLLFLCGKIMDPDCGVCIGKEVFEPADRQFVTDIKQRIVEQTSVYMPEVFIEDVFIDDSPLYIDQNLVMVNITWGPKNNPKKKRTLQTPLRTER